MTTKELINQYVTAHADNRWMDASELEALLTEFAEKLKEPASEDLEKFTERINTFQARYKHPEITSIKGAMAFMARMFYQYPYVAREWYESLPNVTMD